VLILHTLVVFILCNRMRIDIRCDKSPIKEIISHLFFSDLPSNSNQPINLKIFIVPGVVPQAAAEPARSRGKPAIQGAECNGS